jgi:hypothetical protein
MVDAPMRAIFPTLRLALLSLVALVLIALVVSMSNARSGVIHYTPGASTGTIIGIPGRYVPPVYNCSSPGARCARTGHGKKSRGSGTVLLPAESALGVVLAAATVFVLIMARRGRPPEETAISSADAILPPPKVRRRPTNAREAVLSAFADLEERLAGLGFTREPWEAAESYLGRALPDAWRDGRAARRLAELYALARYSHHPIDRATASRAVAASGELIAGLERRDDP